ALFAAAFLFISLVPAYAGAPTQMDMRLFAQLPVLEDGRLKPLNSFARITLKKFSGKDHTAKLSADAWLATSLFDPAHAAEIPVFAVTNTTLRHQLGLEERKDTIYSLAELSAGLEKTAVEAQQWMTSPPKDVPEDAKNLLRIHENALEYTYILRSFSAYLPLQIALTPAWTQKAGLTAGQIVTYQAVQKISPEIEASLRVLLKQKGENVARYTHQEQQLAILGMQLRTMADAGRGNVLLRVIPSGTEWVAPWTILNGGTGSPATSGILKNWQDAAFAWQAQDAVSWNAALQSLAENTPQASRQLLQLEVLMNSIAPFQVALVLFALGFVVALGALCVQTQESARFYKPLIRTASLLIVGALLCQGFGVVARIFIMARPPVGTLYESLLFVGMIAPFLALLFQKKIGSSIAFLVAGLTGSMLSLLAYPLMGEEDTMHVLTAVLNTRFWLATHVLCITIGYGWCLVTSLIAHVILLGDAGGLVPPKTRQSLLHSLQLLAIFSLLFTAVGTIMGGIWADQSWGRFWGWDPKENGALLIVLWIIWVLHRKMAGQLSERQAVMAYAFLSFIVALAWIGVNLLGVGLHSYGFMEGVFWSLGLFGIFEIIVIGAAGYFGQCKKEGVKHAV
ncbi:MAG: cytochrome c biogenesis protein CcsA, partial [Pseudomonadota bacterium]